MLTRGWMTATGYTRGEETSWPCQTLPPYLLLGNDREEVYSTVEEDQRRLLEGLFFLATCDP